MNSENCHEGASDGVGRTCQHRRAPASFSFDGRCVSSRFGLDIALQRAVGPARGSIMKSSLVSLAIVCFLLSPARAVDITACGQLVPAGQTGMLQTDLDCGGTWSDCVGDSAGAC